jgi:hypothetical protein
MVIAPIALGLYFNIYATMNCQKASNTFVFGKSRNKLYIEQRKSRSSESHIYPPEIHKINKFRKAAWLLWISLLGVGLPQAITVLGRLTLPLSLKRVQLLINLLFLAKCLANIFMYYHQMSKRYRGLFYVVGQNFLRFKEITAKIDLKNLKPPTYRSNTTSLTGGGSTVEKRCEESLRLKL